MAVTPPSSSAAFQSSGSDKMNTTTGMWCFSCAQAHITVGPCCAGGQIAVTTRCAGAALQRPSLLTCNVLIRGKTLNEENVGWPLNKPCAMCKSTYSEWDWKWGHLTILSNKSGRQHKQFCNLCSD